MKRLLLTTVFLLSAATAFANDDNSAAVSGSNNDLNQITGNNNMLSTGAGAFGSSSSVSSTNTNTAVGGAGGVASATGGRSESNSAVIDSGNGTGIGVGGGATVETTTGAQTVSVGGTTITNKQRRQAPAVFAPGLVNGFDCNGSNTGGISSPFGSIALGGTEANDDCLNVYLSRELERKGDADGAWGVLCESEKVRKHSSRCPAETVEELIGREVDAPTNGSRNR
ncbi:MAG: hypothetical protein K8U57_36080 [Planctomycetes bacterium]|nr:hypothetical protein [Planctomycetota bacterium]